jgi:hypothetical protein
MKKLLLFSMLLLARTPIVDGSVWSDLGEYFSTTTKESVLDSLIHNDKLKYFVAIGLIGAAGVYYARAGRTLGAQPIAVYLLQNGIVKSHKQLSINYSNETLLYGAAYTALSKELRDTLEGSSYNTVVIELKGVEFTDDPIINAFTTLMKNQYPTFKTSITFENTFKGFTSKPVSEQDVVAIKNAVVTARNEYAKQSVNSLREGVQPR